MFWFLPRDLVRRILSEAVFPIHRLRTGKGNPRRTHARRGERRLAWTSLASLMCVNKAWNRLVLTACLDAYTQQVELLDTFMRALAAEALPQFEAHIAKHGFDREWSFPIERPDEAWDAFWAQWKRVPRLGLPLEELPRLDFMVGWREHRLSTSRIHFGLQVIHRHCGLIRPEHILAEEDGVVAIPFAAERDETDIAMYPADVLALVRRALTASGGSE